jgi:hypothetical protein
MTNRSSAIVVRTLSILTIGVLIWAWQFLMAVVASAESRTAPVIHVVSAPRAEIYTGTGRREGGLTRASSGVAPITEVSVGALHRKAIHSMFHEHSLTVLPMLIGALIVCLVAPIRRKDGSSGATTPETIDRKAV